MCLFGQNRVRRALGPQPLQQQCVGADISGIAQGRRKVVTNLLTHREQQSSGLLRQIGRQLGVGGTHSASITESAAGPCRGAVLRSGHGGRFAGMRFALAAGAAVVALASSLVTGCGTAAPPDPLTGTSWRLLSIESMAPAEQPSTTIDDPSRYTVTFGDNARAAFQVDCNRGNASWELSAAAPDSGSLTFGPIALTKMMCPQPSADSQVAAALGDVRSYLLSDGQLHLALLADGGIMHWEPQR